MAKILLLDDEPVVRGALAAALREMGHKVVEAADGRSGLAAFRNGACDLVITDILMPTQDGLETIRALCASAPDTPIIAISGAPSEPVDYLRIAREFGAQTVLPKPVSEQALGAAVAACLEPRSMKATR